ncbi:MAG: hypothetical protein KJ077_10860 [Anaerolineae bacterium]|nr:hypothetical protein [Anaerolineae bacterium]
MPNTYFEYLYRDEENNKTRKAVVLAGEMELADIAPHLHGGDKFIPHQVGLDDLQENFAIGGYIQPDVDGVWHEIWEVDETEAMPTVEMTAAELKVRFASVTWDVAAAKAELGLEQEVYMQDPNASGTKVEWVGPGMYWFNPLAEAWIKIQDAEMTESISKVRPVRMITRDHVKEVVTLVEPEVLVASSSLPSAREVTWNALKALGYDARMVNVDCFDIHQGGRVHYLSKAEAEALLQAPLPHPVTLADYATWGGLNYWYNFNRRKENGK